MLPQITKVIINNAVDNINISGIYWCLNIFSDVNYIFQFSILNSNEFFVICASYIFKWLILCVMFIDFYKKIPSPQMASDKLLNKTWKNDYTCADQVIYIFITNDDCIVLVVSENNKISITIFDVTKFVILLVYNIKTTIMMFLHIKSLIIMGTT